MESGLDLRGLNVLCGELMVSWGRNEGFLEIEGFSVIKGSLGEFGGFLEEISRYSLEKISEHSLKTS
jgi:hypothetical protein